LSRRWGSRSDSLTKYSA